MESRRALLGMEFLWLIGWAILAPTADGQGAEPPRHADAGQTVERALEHAGRERTYLLHLPTELRTGAAVPLVIALHGLSMNGASMEAVTGLSDVSDERSFIVAYPDGFGRMWRFWERTELGQRTQQESGYIDDVGYIGVIIDELVGEGLVDGRRVYVTGLSNGAYMSNRLAISLADRIAAIAPVAGTMSPAIAELKPPKQMPVLYIHGTDDRIVGFDGVDRITRSKASLSADELVAWWSEQNQCENVLPDETLTDIANDGCRVLKRVHSSESGSPVVFYEIKQGGHTWPDGRFQPEPFLGPVCRDFNASEQIWEFCSQHMLEPAIESP